jgi:hypothetical protein
LRESGELRTIPAWDTSFNNIGPVSNDYIGHSSKYPEASYQQKADIWQDHLPYTRAFTVSQRTQETGRRIQIVAGPSSDLPPALRRWTDECVFEGTKLPSMGYSDDYGPNGILGMALLGRLRVRGKGLRPS